MTMEADTPAAMERRLEALFIDDLDLVRIEACLNRFNPLAVMRVAKAEIRHSNVLSWLLAPNETHGFGDRFLKALLARACRGRPSPKPFHILQADLRDVAIRREWQRIDILALSRSNQWAIVIENKIGSRQGADQLSEYRDEIRKAYGSHETIGILLTVDDETPGHDEFVRIGYDFVWRTIGGLIASTPNLSNEIAAFLNHYLDVLGELTGLNAEEDRMVALARSLYLKHRKALDFIFEQSQSDLNIAADDVFGDVRHGLMYKRNKRRVSFVPTRWEKALREAAPSWDGCEQWLGGGLPLACYFLLTSRNDGPDGSLFLVAEVGPLSNASLRVELIDAIEKAVGDRGKVKFRNTARNETGQYSRFLNKPKSNIDDCFD